MDTITHTLFGLALYGAVNKTDISTKEKRVLLLTTLVGSQIPDIDVVSQWWDTAGRYQMWHRGITHSLFLVPVWAGLLTLSVSLIFKLRGWLWFWIAMIAVFIHDTSDLFNAWGTGYLEPMSSVRVTFGTIPIVDFVFWAIIIGGFLIVRFSRGRLPSHRIFRIVWALIALHICLQTTQGLAIVNQVKGEYDRIALSADFVPGVFTVVGKKESVVTLQKGSLWSGLDTVTEIESHDGADLNFLFTANPRAETLAEWSPFVVVIDDGKRLGVYDPRFYRNGQSFLYEYVDRK